MRNKWLAVGVITAVFLVMTGCVNRLQVGRTQTDSETIELGDADSARVNIEMGIGELTVRGGADSLLEAEFTYNVEDWKPEVAYEIRGSEGRLTIRQPEAEISGIGIPEADIQYEWKIELNEDVPMDLDIDLGVGESVLELSGLSITDLNINVGVGEATIDLSGDWPESFDVAIKGGVGHTTVQLPRDVGVRIETQTGLGKIDVRNLIRNGDVYTNAAYEEADVKLDINVQGGVGNINLLLEE